MIRHRLIPAAVLLIAAACTVASCNPSSPTSTAVAPPAAGSAVPSSRGGQITSAEITGDPVFFSSMGDLWMSTWADDDRLYLSWGDGVGFGDGYPLGYPAYQSPEPFTPPTCGEYELFCQLWCRMNDCTSGQPYPRGALTDAGVLVLTGPVPDFSDVDHAAIDLPSGEPFFLRNLEGQEDISGNNDKPSSLLYLDGRLVLAGHHPAGMPVYGYLAYSEDYGRTWSEVPGSPWGESSNFRVLMFANMGQAYNLNQDGYVYAFGVGTEAGWSVRTVYLARVPGVNILEYDHYEYFTGINGDSAQWSADQGQAVPLENLHTSGQASGMYHEGTRRFLFLTTDGFFSDDLPGTGALYEAPQPWGPWTEVARFCFDYGCNDGSLNVAWTDGKYIAGLISKDAGADFVYFTVSGGDDHYQLQIGKIVLEAGP